jgi:all-trans-retinol dehydrogenase (NAD+)
MNIVLEAIILNLEIFFHTLAAIVHFFLPSRKKNVKGQTVLITGAGSGIGRLLAVRFASLGCKTVLWDINAKDNEETASQIRESGGVCHTYKCDVSDRETVYRTADKVLKDVGDVNILVNNAGIVTGKKFLDCPDAMVEKTMAVNTMAHFWTVKAFLPAMLKKNSGHLVTIASAAGLIGASGMVDYCASKFAAVGFDEALRVELAVLKKTGIHTTVVCPGQILTGMFAGITVRFPNLAGALEPEYVAQKTIEAVLTNQHMLVLPRALYLLPIIKSIFPVTVFQKILDFCWMGAMMETFQGRRKQD